MTLDPAKEPEWPNWGDDGRPARCQLKDGTVVAGKMVAYDYWFDGEGECPMFGIQPPGGELLITLGDAVTWEWTD